MNANEYIVAFHIGRGGRFHNQGHKSYMNNVKSIHDIINLENCTILSTDEDGNELPDNEWVLIDGGSNVILQGRELIESETGILDWDGEYDTDIVQYLSECDEDELDMIYQSYLDGDYMDYELVEYLCTHKGLHKIDKVKFYKTNAEIQCHDCTISYFWDGGEDVTEDDAKKWMEENDIDPVSIEKYASDFEAHFYNN